ncbi:unnamed protein product [Symbiodinium sp. CCMP2592]|nr:unnamed protein product [Symbiodinium sp. CCMP2592]
MTRLPGPLKHGPCARTTRHTLWLKHGAQIEKCTKVMSPNAPPQSLSAASASVAPQLQHFDEPSSENVVRMRMQQMLQIQAPAEVLRLLQSSAAVVADAKTIKDVQSNVRLVAQELEARTERLASCLSGITGDLDGVKHQSERQVTFESTMETRLGALENQIIQLRAQAASADALKDEVVSMKATLSRLEHQQPEIQQSAQTKSEESETRIQRRIDEMDVLLKHFFERVDGNEKLCEKLRQRSEDFTSRFETLQTHVDAGFSSESRALPRRPQLQMPQQIAEEVSDERFEEEAKAQEIIETPKHRTASGVQMFQMTPQRDGADDSWQRDAVDEWLEQVEEPQVVKSVPAEPPGLGSSGAKIPAGQWKLIKDFPKLTIPHGAACYTQEVETGQATHEKISNKGKEAKGKSGKAKAKADKKAAKAAAEAAASAKGDTPEWSEVERGDFSSAEPSSEEEFQADEDQHRQVQPLRLWVLNLTIEDFIMWTRPGHIQSHATSEFQMETNPNSIMWPVWWTIEPDYLDDNEQGVIPVTEDEVMLRCDVTPVLFEDGIIRNVFVVWLLEEETGRERRVAVIRGRVRPIVTPWPNRELSTAASASSPPVAKAPTITAAAYAWRANEIQVIEAVTAVPKAAAKAELSEAVWNEEAYRMTAEESEEIAKAIWESDMLVNPDQDRVQIWIFGMFCHGGVTGITTVTRERPFLTRLLVRFIRQELPTLTFTTISLAIDATLRPHRDLTNAVGSVAGIVGISKFEGGKLWIEDSAGTARRRVSQDEVKTGMLLDVCQRAHIFDPRRWHGADQHRGVRSTVVGYTARQLQRLDQDMTDRLRRLGFNLPEISSKAAVAVASQGKAIAHQAVSEVSDHGAQENSRVHPDDLDDEDEGSSVQPWSVRSAAHGHKRKCRRLTPEEIGEGTLSMDLSGPHPAAFSGHRYFMVANLSRKDGVDIPFSRLLFTKQTEEVAKALTSVMCQIVSLAQGVPPVFRIHSDAGKEFVGGAFQKAVEQCCVWPTMSAPYTPQQNGRAERLVGLLKAAAGSLLLHAQFPLQFWDEAVLEATFLRRCRALKLLGPRAEEGLFLANDERTPGGARVLVTRDGRTTVRVTQMPVLRDVEAVRWRLERGSQDQTVWVSTTGDVKWNAPPSDMITVEESVGEIQPWNDGNTASEKRFKKHLVPEAEKHLFGLFGHGFLVTPVEEEPDGEARVGVVKAERPNPENTKTKYVIYSNKVEQQMIKDEATSQRLMVTETADAGVFVNPSTPEWELNKWMAGLNKELDTMETKNVLEKVRQSEFPKAKPVPRKLVLTKKPMEDSEVIIRSDMGASEIAALIQQAWNPRVRLVACGNFEKDSKAHDPENFAGNPGAETVRILLSLLVRRPTNMTAVVLDISCAFLNARLDRCPDAKPVLIQPPSILYKLGLLEKGFIWRARKAIYGLRRSPRQWEIERNGELDGVTLEPLPHHEHGLLNLESLESGTWLIRDSSGEIQGAMIMYVDDALIIGDLEICARLKAKLSSLWDLKVQGILQNPHMNLVVGETIMLENTPVNVKDELSFLGMKIGRDATGIYLHQHAWISTELKKRGWSTMGGCDNLPDVEEGVWMPKEQTGQYYADLKMCQKELGCLQWVCLRSRPDLSAYVGTLASLQTIDPAKVLKLCTRAWRYLKGTEHVKLHYDYTDAVKECLNCYGDASWATGASRSRSGVWIAWGNHVVMWRSCRQTTCAWSAFEAEVDAAATTCQSGAQIKHLLSAITGDQEMCLFSDNAACVINLVREDGAWITTRTRTVGIRCSYVRDQAVLEGFDIQHMSGNELPADALTKTLKRSALELARARLNLR